MNGLALKFSTDGKTGAIITQTEVSGFAATVQDALVNVATRAGSDPVFPDKGTSVQLDAASGALISVSSAQHSANYAASDTVFFLREFPDTNDPTNANGLAAMKLVAPDFNGESLDLNAQLTSIGGAVVGILATV